MSDSGLSPSKKRMMLYTFSLLIGLGIMGSFGELCGQSFVICSDRTKAVIAMFVLSAFSSAAAAVLAFLDVPQVIEAISALIALVFNTAGTAILSSAKAPFSDSGVVLAWLAELFLVMAMFYLLFSDESPPAADSGYKPTPVSTSPYVPAPPSTGTTSVAPPSSDVPPPAQASANNV